MFIFLETTYQIFSDYCGLQVYSLFSVYLSLVIITALCPTWRPLEKASGVQYINKLVFCTADNFFSTDQEC